MFFNSAKYIIGRCLNIKAFVALALLIAFYLPIVTKNDHTTMDPMGTLLVSESILNEQSIKLDKFGADLLSQYGNRIHKKNEHYYYYFPIGSSIASLPFVIAFKSLGFNVIDSEKTIQRYTSAITSVLSICGLLLISRLFLPYPAALIISCSYWFGSSMVSTSATALWSHNFAILFAIFSIYFTILIVKDGKHYWSLVSTLLFFSYLCRPTMALLSPFIILFIYSYSKSTALKVFCLICWLMSIFVLFSIYEFEQFLPDYYLPKRLINGSFWEAFYGNLLSPSRGLLVFSPFIVASLFFYRYSNKNWDLKPTWLLVGLAWPTLHLIFISRFPHWWGGWSYGPRLMMDVLPGLFLLSIYTWPTKLSGTFRIPLIICFTTSSLFAIAIHTGQGLFNPYTLQWNTYPNVDEHHSYIFDWKYPQFISNPIGHQMRLLAFSSYIERLESGQPIEAKLNSVQFNHLDNRLTFNDWSFPESKHRWSEGTYPSITFKIDNPSQLKGLVTIYVGAFLGEQRVSLKLNGVPTFNGVIRGWYDTIQFSSDALIKGQNTIVFELPDARKAADLDPRILGLAFKQIQIE